MPNIEYHPNGSNTAQSSPEPHEKAKLQYIVSTTSVESPLKSIESVHISEIEDISERNNENPFLDPEVAQHWADVYNDCKYEGRHAFEPAMTWTKEEEKKLVRRLDWHICLWAVGIFLI